MGGGPDILGRMDHDIDRILISREEIAARVREMAEEVVGSYPDSQERITIVTILSGAVIFLADLIRQMPIKMEIGLITVSSYAGATTESRGARLTKDLNVDIRDRDVLIVDDIFDTGGTLRLVQGHLRERQPRSLKTAVLLRKPTSRLPRVASSSPNPTPIAPNASHSRSAGDTRLRSMFRTLFAMMSIIRTGSAQAHHGPLRVLSNKAIRHHPRTVIAVKRKAHPHRVGSAYQSFAVVAS